MPPSIGLYPAFGSVAGNGNGGAFLFILPYLEQQNLYNGSLIPDGRNGGLQTYSEWGIPHGTHTKTYICPSDYTNVNAPDTYASYSQNGQVFVLRYPGWYENGVNYPASFIDGTSNTIFSTDKVAVSAYGDYNVNYWPDWGPIFGSSWLGGDDPGAASYPQFMISGYPANTDGGRPSTPHGADINVAMGDGSVRTCRKWDQRADLVVSHDTCRGRSSRHRLVSGKLYYAPED